MKISLSDKHPTEVFIVASKSKSGLPGPEKSDGGIFMDPFKAHDYLKGLELVFPVGFYGVFRCLMTVEEEMEER